ncbi:MAG: hypothetical protein H6739_15775 [Alphaproteobacteria bacterium]|nr:hypothetical protein [Alphaproteobacteria bacterium]
MTPSPFNLTDDDYWENPNKGTARVLMDLYPQRFDGVLLGAPALVSLEQRHTVPLLAVRAGTARAHAGLSFTEHAIVVAVEPEHNRVYTNFAVDSTEMAPPPPSNAEDPDPDRYGATSEVLELRALLHLPWIPSTYLVSVIMRDQVSNRVQVRLGRPPDAYRDEAVEAYIAGLLSKMEPRTASPPPGDPLPSYQPGKKALEVPEEIGLNLSVQRVVVLKEGATCVLRGAFRLRPRPHEIVVSAPAEDATPADEAPAEAPAETDDGERDVVVDDAQGDAAAGPTPTAVVAITLVITGADRASPTMLRLRVPSFDPIDPEDPEPEVTGHFALDLLRQPGLSKLPQTWFIHAFSSAVAAPPVPYALVPLEWLPTDLATLPEGEE